MDNILDEKQPDTLLLTDEVIFTTIWTSPRRVFKFINDYEYDKHVKVIIVLGGIGGALDSLNQRALSLMVLIPLGIVLGAILGWLSCYIYAALVTWTGGWLNGRGNVDSLFRVLAYGTMPSVIGLIFIIAKVFVYRSGALEAQLGSMPPAALNIFSYGFLGIEIVLWLFTMVFTVVGISEVQKFSIGKAILNSLLPAILFVIPVLTVVILLELF